MRKTILASGECYHIFNRGVDRRQIFMDKNDYLRFLHNMYELNDKNYAPKWKENKIHIMKGQKPEINKNRERLVDICCFCLMSNHFHFVLRQLIDGGVSLFMQKLGMGFANYFNLKYKRSGTLFQGRFKANLIKTDAQIMHLSRYIHVLNPGELIEPQIREGVIQNPIKLKKFLNNYKWSSYLDYLGQKNYPSLINKELIAGYFGGSEDYEKFAMSWKVDDLDKISHIITD